MSTKIILAKSKKQYRRAAEELTIYSRSCEAVIENAYRHVSAFKGPSRWYAWLWRLFPATRRVERLLATLVEITEPPKPKEQPASTQPAPAIDTKAVDP